MSKEEIINKLVSPFPTLADAICARVGCHNISSWLMTLERYYKLIPFTIPPSDTSKKFNQILPGIGLRLVLIHPHAQHTNLGDVKRWVLQEAEFYLGNNYEQPWQDTAPFGLQPDDETPETIITKLGDNCTELLPDDNRQYAIYNPDGNRGTGTLPGIGR